MKTLFIDGGAGTTGLEIKQRLKDRQDFELLNIPPEKRKDPKTRKQYLNEADIVILCLPDDAAKEAVSLISNSKVRIIDASTAHRCHPDWVYGFVEWNREHAQNIRNASRITNPGCYATCAVALIHPLIANGALSTNTPLSIHGVSGYSGGGKTMIEQYQQKDHPNHIHDAFRYYALSLRHKHLAEITMRSGLEQPPLFIPAVGNFYRGMLVSLPLNLKMLTGIGSDVKRVNELMQNHYQGQSNIIVHDIHHSDQLSTLSAEQCANSDNMEIFTFSGHDGQLLLVSAIDNLGKGASGQVIQNLNLLIS